MMKRHCETEVEMEKLERKNSIDFASAFSKTTCVGGNVMRRVMCYSCRRWLKSM
jgi:hypothetical protein